MKTERELSLELMRKLYRLAVLEHEKAMANWHPFDKLQNVSDEDQLRRRNICYAWADAIKHILSFCDAMYGVGSLEPIERSRRGTTPLSAVFDAIKTLRELEAMKKAAFEHVLKQ